MKDLVALVADVQQEKTLDTLLSKRHHSLGIRTITYDIFRHPRKDPGVYHEAADFLSPYTSSYRYALILLDTAWDSVPGDAAFLHAQIMSRMQSKGWSEERCQVIPIVPELEIWVWGSSPVVNEVLRMSQQDIRSLADRCGGWDEGRSKPNEPKQLLETVLRQQRRPRSSALFQELAARVSLRRCQDPAFTALRSTLQRWFSPPCS